jgi:hypothetical protein
LRIPSRRPRGEIRSCGFLLEGRGAKSAVADSFLKASGRIEAYTVLNGDATCASFIGELNQEITCFNEHTHQHAKKDIRNADVDAIAPQPYEAGKPAIVIPNVWYVEKPDTPPVALVFAKDFTVTYRNNDRPGTAELFIHGKGAYRGKKEVTFNIVPNID